MAQTIGPEDSTAAFYTNLETALTGAGPGAELTGRVLSEPACGGPWSVELQHGGPPNALLVLLAERLAAAAAGRPELVAVRLAAEFIGPVPVAELSVRASVLRLSRSAALVQAELASAGRLCLQSRVWLLAPGQPAPAGAGQRPGATPAERLQLDPTTLPPFAIDAFPYASQLDWRVVAGSAYQPGPAAAWVRPRIGLLAGQPLSTLQRAALIADSASGISAELDWQDWSFANVDLDLHLFRPSSSPWLLLEAHTRLGDGVGATSSTVSDRLGAVGFGLQTLLVRRSSE